MYEILPNIFLISAALGFLLSMALITAITKKIKANFFLGLIVFFISMQLLFAWGTHSGYNNNRTAFPFWMFLTYHIIPPSIWLFTKCIFDQTFKLKRWFVLLFLPALVEISIPLSFKLGMIRFRGNLMDYQAWVWFIDYVPLLFLILSLWFFWVKYFQIKKSTGFKKGKSTLVSHVRLLLLMSALSFTCLLWIIFTFVGWKYFSIIEFSLAFLILVFSFLIFLDNENFQFLGRVESNVNFPNYDDSKQLARLEQMLVEKQLYLRPELSLKELSGELKLPSGYVSYLINRYYHKNFKGLINDYRIQAFIQKANLPEEKHKTYLSLALESGFNSKSTFNQAFKSVTGQSPSEYLT